MVRGLKSRPEINGNMLFVSEKLPISNGVQRYALSIFGAVEKVNRPISVKVENVQIVKPKEMDPSQPMLSK